MTETVKIELGTSVSQEMLIIALLGQVYDAPEDALKEYVANSIDAESSSIVIDVSDRRKGTISVQDDGAGMSLSQLRQLPKKVGLSDKRLLEGKIGEKAIGLLAFYSLRAKTLTVWSKTKKDPSIHGLRFTADSIEAELDPSGATTPDWLIALNQGTVVEIEGIDDVQIQRYLTPARLRTDFASRFRSSIAKRHMRMSIREGKAAEVVTTQSYEGTPFSDRVVTTRSGPLLLDLVTKGIAGTDPVEVYCKGQKVSVLSSLISDGLDVQIWSGGYVAGYIDADFLVPATGRSSFLRDQSYWTFIKGLQSVESRLQEEIKRTVDSTKLEKDVELQKRLNQAFLAAMNDLKDLGWSGIEAAVQHPQGNIDATPEAGGAGLGRKGGRRRKGGRGPRSPARPTEGGLVKAVAGPVVNFDEDRFPVDQNRLRSRFDPTQRLISVNTGHTDYIKECAESTRRMDYFHLLLAKELTLYNWGKERPDDVLERMVELHVAAKRHR